MHPILQASSTFGFISSPSTSLHFIPKLQSTRRFATASSSSFSFTRRYFCSSSTHTKTTSTTMHVAKPCVPHRIISDNVYDGMVDAIGNTPLIKLRRASEKTGCNIYGKAEFMNPGGSVKARAALYLIKDAEEKGLLTPGEPGTIVESTAGNTGISLAEIARSRGYRCIIVIPETQSEEKKQALVHAGAELVQVPAKPYTNPNNYIHFGRRLALNIPGAVYMNQFDNPANKQAHMETTGPEIYEQLDGKIDGFVCAVGTGGTLAGTSEYLRDQIENIKIGISDPCGAKLVNYYKYGKMEANGTSITEGIGQGRITGNLEGFTPDYMYEIDDTEGLNVVYALMIEEGLCLGTSSGINIAGAMRLATDLGKGSTVVTVLCDLGSRYVGKMFNLEFLKRNNLPIPEWIDSGLSSDVQASVEETKIDDDVANALTCS